MAARAGMSNLIRRLRGMTQSGTADYTVAGTTWWSDDQLQEVLDTYSTEWNRYPLVAEPEVAGGSYIYQDYYGPRGNWEEAGSGAQYWTVEDSLGTEAGTANYTPDYVKGIVRFNTNQQAAYYYLRARSYDLNSAAADVWRQKAGWRAAYINFKADDQQFNSSEWFDHCMKMAEHYDEQAGIRTSTLTRSDLA